MAVGVAVAAAVQAEVAAVAGAVAVAVAETAAPANAAEQADSADEGMVGGRVVEGDVENVAAMRTGPPARRRVTSGQRS